MSLAPLLLFPMCNAPFNKHKCVFFFLRPVDISVPGLCWAADAKLAGGGGSPWRHDSSGPAGGFLTRFAYCQPYLGIYGRRLENKKLNLLSLLDKKHVAS